MLFIFGLCLFLIISCDDDELREVSHIVSSFERLMCCEVEFFGRCVFEEGATDLFSLNCGFRRFPRTVTR